MDDALSLWKFIANDLFNNEDLLSLYSSHVDPFDYLGGNFLFILQKINNKK